MVVKIILYNLVFIMAIFIARGHVYEYDYLPLKHQINSSFYDEKEFVDYLAKCSQYNRTPYFNICITPYYKQLLKTKSVQEVLNLAEGHVSYHKDAFSDCHFISHEIGSVNYHKNNGSILNSIKDCSDIWLCGGGCHHQIFIEYMDNKSVDEIIRMRDLVCAAKDQTLPYEFEYTCYHSFGHSMALYFDFDILAAKSFCSDLEEEYAYECLDGIYHQSYFRYLDLEFEEIMDNVQLLCKSNISGVDMKACYERAGKFSLTYYGYYNNNSFPKGLLLCSKLDLIKKSYCLYGLSVFPHNCNKSKYACNFIIYKSRFLVWLRDIFIF
jgi:hypothetical protein